MKTFYKILTVSLLTFISSVSFAAYTYIIDTSTWVRAGYYNGVLIQPTDPASALTVKCSNPNGKLQIVTGIPYTSCILTRKGGSVGCLVKYAIGKKITYNINSSGFPTYCSIQ